MIGRPLLEVGQLLGANFHVSSGPRPLVWVLIADRPATGMVHARCCRAVVASDVDQVAVGVGGEPVQISGVVVTELARAGIGVICPNAEVRLWAFAAVDYETFVAWLQLGAGCNLLGGWRK